MLEVGFCTDPILEIVPGCLSVLLRISSRPLRDIFMRGRNHQWLVLGRLVRRFCHFSHSAAADTPDNCSDGSADHSPNRAAHGEADRRAGRAASDCANACRNGVSLWFMILRFVVGMFGFDRRWVDCGAHGGEMESDSIRLQPGSWPWRRAASREMTAMVWVELHCQARSGTGKTTGRSAARPSEARRRALKPPTASALPHGASPRRPLASSGSST